jgi:CPA2 family monovalent cation:H+ antiporter-2
MQFPVELGLIILFSIIGGVLAVRFKQPSVLGLIIIGAIVGPNAIGLISDTSLIELSAEIGAILLLFTIGIEFSLQNLLNLGLRAVAIAIIKLGSVFLISYYISQFLGLSLLTSLYIGVILAVTSTVIVIKVLEQKGLSKRKEVPLLVTVLIIEDVFSVFALAFFSSLNTRTDLSAFHIVTSLIISLVSLLIVYLLIRKYLPPIIAYLIKNSTEDTITFISIGLCAGMSYLAFILDISPSVGAFLAGTIVASLPNSKTFKDSIHPFILTFTALFFFSIGTLVNFQAIWTSIGIVIALFVISIMMKFISVGFSTFLFTNFNGRSATFAGLAMLSVGEFSLLIAKEAKPLNLGIDLISITAAVILLSSLAMSFSLPYQEKIYQFTKKKIPAHVKKDISFLSTYLNSISWYMSADKKKQDIRRVERRKIFSNFLAIIFVIIIGYLIWMYGLQGSHEAGPLLFILLFFVILGVFFPGFSLIQHSRNLIKDVSTLIKKISHLKHLLSDILYFSLFFFLLILFPIVQLSMHLHPLFNLVELLLILLIIIFALKILKSLHIIFTKKEPSFTALSNKYKAILNKKMGNK